MTSSPGYNIKNVDASRVNKSADSFIMSNMNRTVHRGVSASKHQELCINSSFNSKILEAPLLAHAVKLHTCESKFFGKGGPTLTVEGENLERDVPQKSRF